MASNVKFITAKTKQRFEELKSSIPKKSVTFIEDALEIYADGVLYNTIEVTPRDNTLLSTEPVLLATVNGKEIYAKIDNYLGKEDTAVAAAKLDVGDVGGAGNPVYFKDGIPVATSQTQDTHYLARLVVGRTEFDTETSKTPIGDGDVHINLVDGEEVQSSTRLIPGNNAYVTYSADEGGVIIAAKDTITKVNGKSGDVTINATTLDLAAFEGKSFKDILESDVETLTWSTTDKNRIASLDHVKNAINSALSGISGAMSFMGVINKQEELPTSGVSIGDVYVVGTAGLYYNGDNYEACEVNDLIIAKENSPKVKWAIVQANIDGAVTNSDNSVGSGTVAMFDGSTGKIIKSTGFMLKKSVPEDAKFTDTTYKLFTEEDEEQDGGLVARPEKNKQTSDYYLTATGEWLTPRNTSHTHSAGVGLSVENGSAGTDASQTVSYKVNLKDENVGLCVSKYERALTSNTQRFYSVQLDFNGKLAVLVPWTDTTYSAGTGLELDSTTNKFNITAATTSTLGGIKVAKDTEAPTLLSSSETDKCYPLQIHKDNNIGYVRVPWTDSTYTGTSGISVSSERVISTVLKDYTKAKYTSVYQTGTTQFYSVQLDNIGNLAVHVPWTDTVYTAELGVRTNGTKYIADLYGYELGTVSSTYSKGTASNRFYSVQLDKNGKLAVYVPWENTNSEYGAGIGLVLVSSTNTFKVALQDETASTINSVYTKGTDSARFYAVQLDKSGKLAVNVPWENTHPDVSVYLKKDGSDKMTGTLNTLNITPVEHAKYSIGTDSYRYVSGYFSSTVYAPTFSGNATSSDLSSQLKAIRYGSGNDCNSLFSKANRSIVWEATSGASNVPSSHFYHILDTTGHDANYQTQLAIGMTTNAMYYRRKSVNTWQAWKQIAFTDSTLTGNLTGTFNGLQSWNFERTWYLGGSTDSKPFAVILAKAVDTTVTNGSVGSFFAGRVIARRGGTGAWHGQGVTHVNCGGNYTSNIGSFYQEEVGSGACVGTKLCLITYNSVQYICLYFTSTSSRFITVIGNSTTNQGNISSTFNPILIGDVSSYTLTDLTTTTILKTNVTGNAGTATKLQNSRTIWGATFNGTADIPATTTILANAIHSDGTFSINGNSGIYFRYNNDDKKSLVLNASAFKPYDAATGLLTLGTANAKWSTVYANKFEGTATYAETALLKTATSTYTNSSGTTYYKATGLVNKGSGDNQTAYIITSRIGETILLSIGTSDTSYYTPNAVRLYAGFTKIAGLRWDNTNGVLYIAVNAYHNCLNISPLNNKLGSFTLTSCTSSDYSAAATVVTIYENARTVDNVASATNASTLGGYAADAFFRTNVGEVPLAFIDNDLTNGNATGYANYQSGTYSINRTTHSELFINLARNGGSCSALQLKTRYENNADIYFRKTIDANRATAWASFLTSHNYNNYAPTKTGGGASGTWGISITGNAATADSAKLLRPTTLTGSNAVDVIYMTMADNDLFRLRVGGTASNAGYVEIATADDYSEPIYVRQYSGSFATLKRTATLLDGSGNTTFPGKVTANSLSITGAVSADTVTASTSMTIGGCTLSWNSTNKQLEINTTIKMTSGDIIV